MALNHAHAAEKIHLTSVADPGAKTSALVKTGAFEAVQLVLRAGRDIANHKVPGHATIHCLEGRVLIETASSSSSRPETGSISTAARNIPSRPSRTVAAGHDPVRLTARRRTPRLAYGLPTVSACVCPSP
jgi:Acyl-[acyl carrier protein]--UDP-N-acetylglucosamine O-acyltransferase